jgi:thiol-disulfide isomerase/thioredoxin
LLKQSRTGEGKKELNIFLASNPSGGNAELARKLIANPRGGYEPFAPDFQLTTLEGENLELSKLAGKVVVLDFWATWCPSCVAGVPELQELVKKYSRDQMVLISISADSDGEKWRAFIAKKHMEWPQYWDRDRRIRALSGIRAFPTYLVIDKGGITRHRVVGTNPQASVAFRLKPILQALLKPNTQG